jgi:enoyl-CoA hydratase/carnithine racemase
VSYENILYEVEGPIATITLNRPETLNAISRALETELHQALDVADRDANVRAIILTGAGRAFCSGYDLTTPGSPRKLPPEISTDEFLRDWHERSMAGVWKIVHLWQLTKPVIAALNGWTMGGGLWYSTACDISIASEKAVFAQPEVREISNTTYLLTALCGWKVANRWALTGDHMDAQEALRVGLVNEVVPHDQLMPRTRALAERIAMVPEASVRINKAIAMQGLMVSGVFNALLQSGPLSTVVQASIGGPRWEELHEAQKEGGMRAFLDARDGPFLPELTRAARWRPSSSGR